MIASLKLRLAASLFVGQVLIYLVSYAAVPIFSMFDLFGARSIMHFSYTDAAWFGVRDLVLGSLRRAHDGVLILEPSAALRARSIRNPELAYLVLDRRTRSVVQGSSPSLVAELSRLRENSSLFDYAGNLAGSEQSGNGALKIGLANSPLGDLIFAAKSYEFEWIDLWAVTLWSIDAATIWSPPVLLASAIIVWLTLGRGLRSLSAVSNQAARIDLERLGERLPSEGLPSEMVPVVDSINAALDRVEDGVARQRRFIANAAHELRTPVAILRARIDAIEATRSKPELQSDIRRLQNILEQLLSTARASDAAGGCATQIDLGEAVGAVAADYLPLAIKNERHLEFNDASGETRIRGDRRALASVVGNLIDNALRAEPEGGVVLVSVDSEGGVAVIDHGEGVAREDREAIFEPFWRKSESTPGAGLGLAIAKELVEKLGGRIWVEDTPGGGATFKLRFPARGDLNRCSDVRVAQKG
jgi:signal transduction histidine kinase